MQSWRKGIKPSSTPLSSSTDKDHHEDDTQILPHPHTHSHGEADYEIPPHDLKLSQKMAPLQFFKTCRTLASLAVEYYPNEKDTLSTSFTLLGLLGDEPSDEDASEMGESMIETFSEQFKNSFDTILNKDDAFFDLDHPILQGMGAKEKWMALTSVQKRSIWVEMAMLVQYSNLGKMYSLCPSKMMDMITSMADKVSKQVANGEMKLDSLNPMELGQSLVSSMTPEEIEDIGRTLMEKDTMEDMMRLMQTSMKGLQGGGGMPSNMPMPDFSQMASIAAMLQKK
jgi:hypothetical protein